MSRLLNPSTAWTVLVAGALATVAFDLFGQGLSPLAGFAKLAPVGLAQQTLSKVFGTVPNGAAHTLHALTGLLAYPLGYLLVARPIADRVLPALHWSVVATTYGVVLWIFALYVMASLVAGNPPFLAFSGITWVALWGHILYALVAAAVIEARLPRPVHLPTAA
ncbi:hypothetical protein MWU52_09875 [Jannaschia sp. S6380]|uniref:hypothetical protein n=1 Tax=Jannaschia sp. S6380 TaxID=2926408 RepID=UPI001FF68816|nr:hypothetical protein [Jannaschia sp. S6380]MCK0167855.1 hypothetical protein [Jannaschia sp. S6380]